MVPINSAESTNEKVYFQRSPYCSTGACIEVAFLPTQVLIRDSKAPDSQLAFNNEEWAAFAKWIMETGAHDDAA